MTKTGRLILAGLLLAAFQNASAQAPQPDSPLDRLRGLEYPPNDAENFDKGWQQRVLLEFDLVNHADLDDLRAALEDETGYVRAAAARCLGIRGDRESVEMLAKLAVSDPDHAVRCRAVESLGFLKARTETIEQAKKDEHPGVVWAAKLAAEEAEHATDFAAIVRQAFAAGLEADELDRIEIGSPAPAFSALTLDGETFELSSLLGKKPLAIYFTAHDG